MADDWTREELERDHLSKFTAVTIPVGVSVVGSTRVLNLHETEKILKGVSVIALGNCGCRERMKRCDKPVDVCLTVNRAARDEIREGIARRINLHEAMDVLRRSYEAGLVHVTYTVKDKNELSVICRLLCMLLSHTFGAY